MARNKHLTLSDRIVIEKGLNNNASRKSIADTLGMDKSSICKEIKNHAFFKPFSRQRVSVRGTYDCIHINKCGFNSFCTNVCANREPIPCKTKDSSSGVCNGCYKRSSCKLTKKLYQAEKAQEDYETTLIDSRLGWNITYKEIKVIVDTIKPLLEKGQSIAHILMTHPEIRLCEKTIYNYIDQGAFEQFGIKNLDLRYKVSRKMSSKKKREYKPRKDNKYLIGRTYKNFEAYMIERPNASVVEMDTVYNDISNGPFIQTFQFVDYHFMKGIYHDTKTAQDMLDGIQKIYDALGKDTFKKIFEVILTDRGAEFVYAEEMEKLGCRVFYCDPMASCQKPHVENNHNLFRFICPSKTDLKKIGLHSQEDVDLIFSHVNSYARESLKGKSPIEVFHFFHSESKVLEKLEIKEIDPKDINLTSNLIKK